jgi:Domain of unknown function (DUF1871)
MKTRADYDTAIDIVGAVIKDWDPYSLLATGAPTDEFDMEIERLVTRIPHIHSSADAAREIAAVFSHYFEAEDFPVEACTDVGAELFHQLEGAQLLSTPKA